MATTTRPEDTGQAVDVLVVDPSETAAGFAADALEFAAPSLAVSTAADPEAALDFVEEEDVDCVVCEYRLSDRTGVEFLERARERAPGVRGVIHTLEEGRAVAQEAWDSGFAYAQKGHEIDRYDVIARHILTPTAEVEV